MTVPLMDLSDLTRSVQRAAADVGQRFIGGDYVRDFEKQWAERVCAAQCVGVGNGTDALELLLEQMSLEHPQRGVVIVPATSFVATLEAVLRGGWLIPHVVDVTPDGLMDVDALRAVLQTMGTVVKNVLAIVPVHLYGQVVEGVEDVAAEFGIPYVIDDACQAHGARYADGAPLGSRNPAAWSFMPAKILGAGGDAGAVTLPANCKTLADKIRQSANHGRSGHNAHGRPGRNSRLDAVHAATLDARLHYLDEDLAERERAALWYNHHLSDYVKVQPNPPGRAWAYYTVWVESDFHRTGLRKHLNACGVETGCHYPYTLLSAFDSGAVSWGGSDEVAASLARTALTLPLWPGISAVQQHRVVQAVHWYYKGER